MPVSRTRRLNEKPVLDAKTCVLYVMARDQRVRDNHALAAAQSLAQERKLPFAVVFCLQPSSGVRAREHYTFMLEGLRQVESELEAKGVRFLMVIGNPLERLGGVMYHLKPAALFFDFSPLRGPQALHRRIAGQAECAVFETDTHNVVPVWDASPKQEVGARTLRPKIRRLLADALEDEAPALRQHPHPWPGTVRCVESLQPLVDEVLAGLPSNGTDISRFNPGEQAAAETLQSFIGSRLRGYAEKRNDPVLDGQSGLSPYLHFGQLSSAAVVRAAEAAAQADNGLRDDVDKLTDELVVRKELSDNFCFYNHDYDRIAGAPQWGQASLAKHAGDPREFVYDAEQLENARTHDEAWNASQRQLVHSGKMHGYMRMYWAKKVLEWSPSPEVALDWLIKCNDFYSLDGGDPSGYANILWSVGGLHDRPWGERPVYGIVRSMVYSGLKRKFDIAAHERQWPAKACCKNSGHDGMDRLSAMQPALITCN
jgi:deoxyribodipyrimidine photo-lyase